MSRHRDLDPKLEKVLLVSLSANREFGLRTPSFRQGVCALDPRRGCLPSAQRERRFLQVRRKWQRPLPASLPNRIRSTLGRTPNPASHSRSSLHLWWWRSRWWSRRVWTCESWIHPLKQNKPKRHTQMETRKNKGCLFWGNPSLLDLTGNTAKANKNSVSWAPSYSALGVVAVLGERPEAILGVQVTQF